MTTAEGYGPTMDVEPCQAVAPDHACDDVEAMGIASTCSLAGEGKPNEIRAFLTSRRNRLTPEQVGIASYGRRRVPGLRPEEVAALAGISVEYYTQLERGRGLDFDSLTPNGVGSGS